MIGIKIIVFMAVEAAFSFADKARAKAAYQKCAERDSCYTQVVVDGRELNTAQARRFFGMPTYINAPQAAKLKCKLPYYSRRKR